MSEETEVVIEQGSWDEDFKSKEEKEASKANNQERLSWMDFPKAGTYRVRLCGKFVKFYRWWSPFTGRLITHLSYKDKDPAWNAGFWPRKTFAIHVIDRADGKLKILEKGNQIFNIFAKYQQVNGINPAGKDGPDFEIEVVWPGGNKRQATYTVTALAKPAPWTKEEVEMIKSKFADFNKIYKASPLEDIIAAWNALPDEAKIPEERDDNQGKRTETKTASKPVPVNNIKEKPPEMSESDDDLFGDTDDSTDF